MYDQISICLNRHHYYQYYLFAIHLLVALCLWVLSPSSVFFVLFIIILLYSYFLCKNRCLFDAVLRCKKQQFWLLEYQGRSELIELQQALVWPWFCCLRFYCPHEKTHYYFSIFEGSVDAEEWRSLRVLLTLAPLKKVRLP